MAESRTVLVLTDEELVVLAGADQAPMSLPYYSDIPAGQARNVMLGTALRSLMARGLVDLPDESPAGSLTAESIGATGLGRTGARLQDGLAAILGVRGASPVKVCFQRTTARGRELIYAHPQSEVVLFETLRNQGVHAFSVVARDDLDDAVRALLVPEDAKDGQGEAISVPAGDGRPGGVQVLQALSSMVVVTDVVVRHAGDGGAHGFYSVACGPEGTYLSEASLDAAAEQRYEPISVETMVQRLLASITEAESQVATA